MSIRGTTVAVLGGDRRMAEAVRFFRNAGAQVRVAGLDLKDRTGVFVADSGAQALTGANVAVLPVMGVSEDGTVQTLQGAPTCVIDLKGLREMAPGATVFSGIANQLLRQICAEARLPLVEYREQDEFAIWNSIPSAEGAIQMAMESSPLTIFDSRSLVLGFGRTGKAVALLLRGLFSDVTVVARKENDYARIWAAGHRYAGWDQLAEAVSRADIIFNTVPAMVLTKEVLAKAPDHAVVIDVASAPGGTDFAAARERGITARLAPGLPGIVAPVTAGKIIAELIVRHLTTSNAEEGER